VKLSQFIGKTLAFRNTVVEKLTSLSMRVRRRLTGRPSLLLYKFTRFILEVINEIL